MSLVLFRNGKLFDGLAAETRDGLEVLVILALAVNLLGDWLRDALNPKLR